ncbi:HNH endonuclease [Pseudomonas lutea]|uniref:HNH endonuclease n=1 Tax=Pseudomonas lutea TaxID=243924 RepID=UPI00068BCB4A|nr:HNH endonuclease [Pseudomonas lutea]
MSDIDANALAGLISNRFLVPFDGTVEDVEGGRFIVIRPSDLDRGTGFSIVVGRTPRRVEASFKADRFAGALLRLMGEADSDAQSLFITLLQDAKARGLTVNATLDDSIIETEKDLSARDWSRFEIDCDKRMPLRAITNTVAFDALVEVTATCTSLALSLLQLEDSREFPPLYEDGLPEGASMKVTVNRYERNKNNRAACIAHHGSSCKACGFNFGAKYGSLGKDVIEVHHLVMVSDMGGSYKLDPRKDLVPVCSNCHTIMHRRDPPLTVSEMQNIINTN